MTATIDLSYEEWIDKYKPELDADGSPRMYETYGKDYEYIQSVDTEYLWTWTDGGDYSVITNGFSFVNRLNYYVCAVPCSTDIFVQIDMYDPTECEQTGNHYWYEHERYDGTMTTICSECEVDKNDIDN
jgi:hypothetical protein